MGLELEPRIQRPPDGSEPNYIRNSLPDVSIADTGSEEVEIETGISIMDRAILRYLGLGTSGLTNLVSTNVDDKASSETDFWVLNIQTRTGAEFKVDDPELVDRRQVGVRSISDSTNTTAVIPFTEEGGVPEGGQLVASPRIVYRQQNELGTSVSPDSYEVRLGYEFEDVTMNMFLELAEMHADIFLV